MSDEDRMRAELHAMQERGNQITDEVQGWYYWTIKATTFDIIIKLSTFEYLLLHEYHSVESRFTSYN